MKLALLSAFALTGCTFGIGTPVSVEAPLSAIDVDAARTQLEHAICKQSAAARCSVLRSLDATDGVAADPPALPLAVPQRLHALVVADWLEQQRQLHDLVPSFTTIIDKAIPAQMLKGASVTDGALLFTDDTLSVDLPALLVSVSKDGVETAVGVFAPHAAGSGEPSSLSLAEGGSDAIVNALSGGASVVLAPAADVPLGLLLRDDATFARPGGSARVSLSLSFDVQTSKTLDLNVSVKP